MLYKIMDYFFQIFGNVKKNNKKETFLKIFSKNRCDEILKLKIKKIPMFYSESSSAAFGTNFTYVVQGLVKFYSLKYKKTKIFRLVFSNIILSIFGR